MNYALITGASRGIGYELAVQFAKNGHNLVLVSRDKLKLSQVSAFLENNYRIKTLVISCDLSLPGAADEVYGKVSENNIIVDYLVNNAGFYVKGYFSETSWKDESELIQLQCLTHTRLIKSFLPAMTIRGKGGILNVASIGSFVPGPFNAVYCAAKSFVLSLSEALAEEVSGTGVGVTALCPGGTKTAFWNGTNRNSSFLFPLKEDSWVAAAGYRALMKGKRVVIPGKFIRFEVALSRLLPRKFIVRIAGNMTRDL